MSQTSGDPLPGSTWDRRHRGVLRYTSLLYQLRATVDPGQYIHLHCFTGTRRVAEQWLNAFPSTFFGFTVMPHTTAAQGRPCGGYRQIVSCRRRMSRTSPRGDPGLCLRQACWAMLRKVWPSEEGKCHSNYWRQRPPVVNRGSCLLGGVTTQDSKYTMVPAGIKKNEPPITPRDGTLQLGPR